MLSIVMAFAEGEAIFERFVKIKIKVVLIPLNEGSKPPLSLSSRSANVGAGLQGDWEMPRDTKCHADESYII